MVVSVERATSDQPCKCNKPCPLSELFVEFDKSFCLRGSSSKIGKSFVKKIRSFVYSGFSESIRTGEPTTMPFVYLGVHLPFKSYRKIKVENFDLSNKTEQLREEARKAISELPAEEFGTYLWWELLDKELRNQLTYFSRFYLLRRLAAK